MTQYCQQCGHPIEGNGHVCPGSTPMGFMGVGVAGYMLPLFEQRIEQRLTAIEAQLRLLTAPRPATPEEAYRAQMLEFMHRESVYHKALSDILAQEGTSGWDVGMLKKIALQAFEDAAKPRSA